MLVPIGKKKLGILCALALAGACGRHSQSAPADLALVDDGGDEPSNDGVDGGQPPPTPPPVGDGGTPGAPIPTKIRYVMVLVKENHTLDNYFTGFANAATSTTARISSGATVTRPTAPTGPLPQDICHANSCGQRAWDNGAMDAFDTLAPNNLSLVRYTEAQIPNYWAYAKNFVLADHLFSTTMGPSTPGHFVFWTGQSKVLTNQTCSSSDPTQCTGMGCAASAPTRITAYDPNTCATSSVPPCFDIPSLVDNLPAGFTWSDYGGALALMVKSIYQTPGYQAHFRSQASLVADLTAGHIANLTIAHLWSGDESEHPPAYPCVGENFTVDIVNAAMQLPQWNEMAIVVTWDDWGGFYDHVAPPTKKCANGQVFEEGFRLPAIIISPYAKKGVVLSSNAEQASVPKLVEELWGMPMMSARDPNARDGSAGSLLGAFDFTQPPRAPLLLSKHACP